MKSDLNIEIWTAVLLFGFQNIVYKSLDGRSKGVKNAMPCATRDTGARFRQGVVLSAFFARHNPRRSAIALEARARASQFHAMSRVARSRVALSGRRCSCPRVRRLCALLGGRGRRATCETRTFDMTCFRRVAWTQSAWKVKVLAKGTKGRRGARVGKKYR